MDGRVHRKETRINKQDEKVIQQKKGNGTDFTGVTSCTAMEQKHSLSVLVKKDKEDVD